MTLMPLGAHRQVSFQGDGVIVHSGETENCDCVCVERSYWTTTSRNLVRKARDVTIVAVAIRCLAQIHGRTVKTISICEVFRGAWREHEAKNGGSHLQDLYTKQKTKHTVTHREVRKNQRKKKEPSGKLQRRKTKKNTDQDCDKRHTATTLLGGEKDEIPSQKELVAEYGKAEKWPQMELAPVD